MAKKSGRPPKSETHPESKQKIVHAAIELIRTDGADAVTVRNVCAVADLSIGTFYHYFQNKDDLLMHFLRETSFDGFELETPVEQIADRVCELYMHLIEQYRKLGVDFMKSFYTTGNHALSAYMGEENGCFAPGTVMERSEREVSTAMEQGVLRSDLDIHKVSMDICTIVKGCVFEYNLTNEKMDLEGTLRRILERYIAGYMK
jgi:AcrR family transcriptional regulator